MSAAATPLLFNWSPPQRRRHALVLFLVASLLLHAFCFYIFQIVYPPTVSLAPAPARISVISPDDPESLTLLRWVEAEDPALASATQRPANYRATTLPRLDHIASYTQHEPALKTVPEPTPDLRVPSSAAIGQMPRPRTGTFALSSTRKTTAVFSDAPSDFAPPDFTFHLSRADAPANATFRVAIDQAGVVRYCFRTQSSGDPALDEQAQQFLLLSRFSPRGQSAAELTWSTATVLWGNDFAPLPSPPPRL